MANAEYGRVRVLAEKLASAGVAEDTIAQIMEGSDEVHQGSRPEKKAAWMGELMRRMDALLDERTVRAVREDCACCLSGKRGQLSRAIAKEHESLEERVRAANETKLVFGHSVSLEENGDITVCFAPEGLEQYRCVCLPKAKEPLPISYCYCCGGHAKHHAQIALGIPLEVTVLSSPLASGGKEPCRFRMRPVVE
jgi:hypothetical protein